jgi:UDP-3-O-[3-hydroxymyristoyl] N-acetylglucosamine deacetylase
MDKFLQKTLRGSFTLVGTGVHSGRPVCLTVKPAGPGHGIWFKRIDLACFNPFVKASYDLVSDTELSTSLKNSSDVIVSQVEHLLAALAGTGVNNALIELDNSELPILDGSAKRFVKEILNVGLVKQPAQLIGIKVTEKVRVQSGIAWAEIAPSKNLQMNVTIDYPSTFIKTQNLDLSLSNGTFVRELCDSRTFCLKEDIETMRAKGLALGGSLENALVICGDGLENEDGLRWPDEFVRHKMLDALGDLSLAGAPLLGSFRSYCGGHALNNKLLRKLLQGEDSYILQAMKLDEGDDFLETKLSESDLLAVG